MKIKELLEKVLEDLKKTSGIEATAIGARDGLVIASSMEKPEVLVAMSATLLGSAEHAVAELGKGVPERVIVETPSGKMVAVGAGPDALLLVIANTDVGFGLLLLEVEKAAEKIKKILE